MKKIKVLILSLALAMLVNVNTAFAARNTDPNENDKKPTIDCKIESQIHEMFKGENISKEIEEKLTAKIKSGELLDCMNPEMLKKVPKKV